MQRRSLGVRCRVIAVSIAFVATACQADDGDEAVGGTPIEEPSTVTESTSEPTSSSDAAATASDGEDPDTTSSADDTSPPADPTTTIVFATQPPSTPPVVTAPPGEPSTETVYDVGTIDPGLAPFVQIAVDDLADRLTVDPASIEVLTAVLVTWPDSALGCREPDRAYAPVLIDGAVIELGLDELVYRYHSGGERPPFPCDRPLDPVPVPIT